MTGDRPRILAVGRRALLLEATDAAGARRLHAAVQGLVEQGAEGLALPDDVVPAARTVLLDGLDDAAGWRVLLERLDLAASSDLLSRGADRLVRVRYDGPDLAEAAQAWGCSPEAVARRHTSASWVVAFTGFAPGFAYCVADPPLPPVPRRTSPRERLSAGAVALGGEYSAVYPVSMPGGWQVIGHTDQVMFDPASDQPAYLAPGDAVRFEEAE